jgi:hypothetical protein
MVYGCGNRCVKFFLVLINSLICLSGMVLFGVSLWANLDKKFNTYWDDLNTGVDISQYKVGIWILVGVGAFLFFIGFLGCCGAWCENKLLLGLFFVVVLIITVVELAAAIYAIVQRNKIKAEIEKGLNEAKKKAGAGDRDTWKKIQDEFKCCGVDGTPVKPEWKADCGTYEGTGCVDAIWDWIKTHAAIAGGIAIAVIVIEILAMVFACVMCSAIGKGDWA